jgi:hypothetical protein
MSLQNKVLVVVLLLWKQIQPKKLIKKNEAYLGSRIY